ncbi:hypothetical protein [Micromonospora sp. CB01531]|uniref:hypothetical protein n=1 Tax=Micromonospora sp. CB01531 TaxID=1718947 RepID=UPI0009394216|nr:hypothetical protein [Micromonospora sp. CB01531]OKI47201.1 hypothetical protein A6A27_10130 [Micromonospora sp. CB01531]
MAAATREVTSGSFKYEACCRIGALEVEAFTHAPAPEDPEKAAMRARLAELEAQLAEGGPK